MGYVHTCDINPPEKSEWTLKEILGEIDDAAMNLPNPTYWVIQEDLMEIWKRYGGEKSKPRWIPVEERLPEACETVLVYRVVSGGYVQLTEICFAHTLKIYDKVTWSEVGVTHWMPLPEPPEMEK